MCHHAKFRQNRPKVFWDIVIFWFSRWPPSAIFDFEVFKFLVNRQIGRPNMHRRTKCQTVAEISHLTIFKMAAVRHFRYFKVWFFDQLVTSGGLIYAIMQNFVKIGQKVFEISWFFDFQYGRRPPSWILKFWNFWLTIILGGPICIAVPNFTKTGQTVAEISHLTIFKMAAVRHFGFFKVWFFDQLVTSGGLTCAIMQNFVKIGQTVSEISRFFDFQDGHRPPSWIC